GRAGRIYASLGGRGGGRDSRRSNLGRRADDSPRDCPAVLYALDEPRFSLAVHARGAVAGHVAIGGWGIVLRTPGRSAAPRAAHRVGVALSGAGLPRAGAAVCISGRASPDGVLSVLSPARVGAVC